MVPTIDLRTEAPGYCHVHGRVHQDREHPVPCWLCRKPTTHAHGAHPECARRFDNERITP